MKNVLIIVAHPKEESFSFAMANTYKETSESKGNNIKMLDLYRDTHQQPFFTYCQVQSKSVPQRRAKMYQLATKKSCTSS